MTPDEARAARARPAAGATRAPSKTPTPTAGAPAELADGGEITPLMRQYDRVKAAHRDAILIFRLGDFYEMFNEDAVVGAAALDLTLTSRNNGKARRVPLAGFPVKAAQAYIGRLIAAGYKVAVCEQMEDPKTARGLVKREVVEVVTPGTLLDEAFLEGRSGNFLAALALRDDRLGLACADVSTGAFHLGEVPLEDGEAELGRVAPAEVLVPASWCERSADRRARLGEVTRPGGTLAALCGSDGRNGSRRLAGVPVTARDDGLFDPRSARERLLDHLGVVALAGFGIPEESPAVDAGGALLAYLAEVQPQGARALGAPRWVRRDDGLLLDETTLRNLEVFRAFHGDDRHHTLLGAVDATLTPPGARLLREWLLRPAGRREPITERQDAVEFLRERGEIRARLRRDLRGFPDVPRIVARCAAGRAGPRDLGALREALGRLPALRGALGAEDPLRADASRATGPASPAAPVSTGAILPGAPPALLTAVAADLAGFADLEDELAHALVDDPPPALADGPAIRPGHDERLDALREARVSGVDWIAALQQRERARTGISSLKVGYNRVFGYYIEVTRANLSQVPGDYVRKQTIANGERYVTPELKEVEARVLEAEEGIAAREAELFTELRERVAGQAAELRRLGEAIAALDVLAGFAETAAERGYCRPQLVEEPVLELRGARHPVVELQAGAGAFVPNDTELGGEQRIMVLTGPNMAGKSTYLRQVGLVVLLAHAGSFVPAESARVGLTDRIFTRVGAADDLARGRSTFLVEMVETANILRNATPRSLVLLDEIGRGTATFDGLSLAWSVTEWLHARPGGGPRTIFATHYHELTELASLLPRVFNAHVQVKEWGEEIVFLKKVAEGKSDRSYGIQVARLAGIPPEVVERAREILANLESGEFTAAGLPRRSRGRSAPRPAPREQITIFEAAPDSLRDELAALDVDALRPLEALNLVAEWKRRYGGSS